MQWQLDGSQESPGRRELCEQAVPWRGAKGMMAELLPSQRPELEHWGKGGTSVTSSTESYIFMTLWERCSLSPLCQGQINCLLIKQT